MTSTTETEVRTCRLCQRALPETAYFPSYWANNSLRCRDCEKARRPKTHATPEYQRDYRNRRLAGDPAYGREGELKRRYGITLAEYDHMLTKQGGKCAICRQGSKQGRENGKIYALHVDHNHETGQVRSLLCTNCNNALGSAKDNAALLRVMADYLDGWSE